MKNDEILSVKHKIPLRAMDYSNAPKDNQDSSSLTLKSGQTVHIGAYLGQFWLL